MDITFERGNKESPKGHAFLYFKSALGDEIWCTYVVMLPISFDVAKYVPPFLMNQMGDLGPKDLSAFAFPPAPEKMESYQYLQDLADMRDDDILYGGTYDPNDVASGMMVVSEAVQEYAGIYGQVLETQQPATALGESSAEEDLGINEVLYGLMIEPDKLSELTKLISKLRFAVEGSEESIAREAEVDINLLAKHLPENHRTSKLVQAVKARGTKGEKLADLYLRRCFHILTARFLLLCHRLHIPSLCVRHAEVVGFRCRVWSHEAPKSRCRFPGRWREDLYE